MPFERDPLSADYDKQTNRRSICKPQWHEVTRKGRWVTVTMFTGSSGMDHVEQHPESSYLQHPELRSSG
jgi:hypothetical protein